MFFEKYDIKYNPSAPWVFYNLMIENQKLFLYGLIARFPACVQLESPHSCALWSSLDTGVACSSTV